MNLRLISRTHISSGGSYTIPSFYDTENRIAHSILAEGGTVTLFHTQPRENPNEIVKQQSYYKREWSNNPLSSFNSRPPLPDLTIYQLLEKLESLTKTEHK